MIEPSKATEVSWNDKDFEIEWYSGTGAGGQHRNKHQNSCRITHLASGMVSTAQCRSRENSLQEAKTAILEKLNGKASQEHREEVASVKKDQVGSGMRGDKVRTIQFQNDVVTDHRNGKKMNATKFMKGFMDQLWD